MAEFFSAAAGKGGSRMETAPTDIDENSSSSDFLRDIVIVIGGLSFRINLLDMNPAITSAPAGDTARGAGGFL